MAASLAEAASSNSLELVDGERVAWLGDSLAGRETLFGHVELMVVTHFPDRAVTVRNFGGGLEGTNAVQRAPAADFALRKEALARFKPTVVMLAYSVECGPGGAAGVTNLAGEMAQVITGVRALSTSAPPRVVLMGVARRDKTPAGLYGPVYDKALTAAEQSLRELAGREKARYVTLFRPLDDSALLIAPPRLMDDQGLFTEYGYRRLAEAVGMGLEWEPHVWRLGILEGGAVREGVFGVSVSQVEWTSNRVRLAVMVEQLPIAAWGANQSPRYLAAPASRMHFPGLAPGLYDVNADGVTLQTVSHETCAQSFRCFRGPDFDQAEALRQAILRKNDALFHRDHPGAACPSERHASGSALPGPAELETLVADAEREMASLRKPAPHRLELVPAFKNGAAPAVSPAKP